MHSERPRDRENKRASGGRVAVSFAELEAAGFAGV